MRTWLAATAVLTAALAVVPSARADTTVTATVDHWSDGDTVVTDLGPVRLIGINAPDVGACGYGKATKLAESLAPCGDDRHPHAPGRARRHRRLRAPAQVRRRRRRGRRAEADPEGLAGEVRLDRRIRRAPSPEEVPQAGHQAPRLLRQPRPEVVPTRLDQRLPEEGADQGQPQRRLDLPPPPRRRELRDHQPRGVLRQRGRRQEGRLPSRPGLTPQPWQRRSRQARPAVVESQPHSKKFRDGRRTPYSTTGEPVPAPQQEVSRRAQNALLNHRRASPSPTARGFETGAERPPQPPASESQPHGRWWRAQRATTPHHRTPTRVALTKRPGRRDGAGRDDRGRGADARRNPAWKPPATRRPLSSRAVPARRAGNKPTTGRPPAKAKTKEMHQGPAGEGGWPGPDCPCICWTAPGQRRPVKGREH